MTIATQALLNILDKMCLNKYIYAQRKYVLSFAPLWLLIKKKVDNMKQVC